MIQLHDDYLYFRTTSGETIPCSAELVAIELVGESISQLDPELLRHAAAAVLHYFKDDLGRESVTVPEFSKALERVLKGLGFQVQSSENEVVAPAQSSDLSQLVNEGEQVIELHFFLCLRDEIRKRLAESPELVRFTGLRSCVMRLAGAKRWSHRCQALYDQVLDYLRHCYSSDGRGASCGMIVQ
jgi:hypothetical protein